MTDRHGARGMPASLRRIAAAAGYLFLLTAAAPPQPFAVHLGPTPFTDATRAKVRGRGAAEAKLVGDKLTVTGRFDGLAGPATAAQLHVGLAIGVPGPVLAPLTVTAGLSGEVQGEVVLKGPQLKALREGRLYLQINSQVAPEGALWGWMLTPQPKMTAEPKAGRWFLPQIDMTSR